MSRPISEWADRLYLPRGEASHLVPFGTYRTLCQRVTGAEWHGTGSFEEQLKASTLPLCRECERHL